VADDLAFHHVQDRKQRRGAYLAGSDHVASARAGRRRDEVGGTDRDVAAVLA
jgi:hypothetical protein